MAQKWYQKATVQAAMAAGVLALLAAIVGPPISRNLWPSVPVEEVSTTIQTAELRPILLPPQEQLLELLAKYQKKFSASKLVISRSNGRLYFDDDPERGADVSLIKDLYGSVDERNAGRFEELVQNMPTQYLRLIAEARFDNPFVMNVTEAGIKYLERSR
jgi:hypothetical protein